MIHLVTRDTSNELTRKAGVEAFDIQHHTTTLEFYIREIYTWNSHSTGENSPWINTNSSLFTKVEREGFKTLANKVNQAGQGVLASLFLREMVL